MFKYLFLALWVLIHGVWADNKDPRTICLKLLEDCQQTNLIDKFNNASREEQDRLAEQVIHLDEVSTGGLVDYCDRSRIFLRSAQSGHSSFEGYIPSIPSGVNVDLNSEEFHHQEKVGIEEMKNSCLVLAAGGLGERLGYSSIKLDLPISLIKKELSYMKYYWDYIKAFEERVIPQLTEIQRKDFYIPFAIMTSEDTHNRTIELLEKHNYFGLQKEQVRIIMQEKVPSFIDNDATFSLIPDKLEIETKPHGHGDVHKLLYSQGIAQQWQELGKKWIIFFQDTNALGFKAIPSAVGISKEYDFDINTVAIPRKPGEAIGAMTALTDIETNTTKNTHIEYNQLVPLLKKAWDKDGDIADQDGNSYFPGNAGTIIFKLSSYMESLKKTKGEIPEFVNPKFKEGSKTEFKSSARLECIVPGISKLYDKDLKVSFSMYDRWFPFSSVKNNFADAIKRYHQGLHPEWGATGEFDIFEANRNILRMMGVEVEATTEVDDKNFHGIKVRDGAKVFIHPSFGVTFKEIQNKLKGNWKISKRSVLWLEGKDTQLKDLDLDSTLITGEERSVFEGEHFTGEYIEFDPLKSLNENADDITEVNKIKGFRLKRISKPTQSCID